MNLATALKKNLDGSYPQDLSHVTCSALPHTGTRLSVKPAMMLALCLPSAERSQWSRNDGERIEIRTCAGGPKTLQVPSLGMAGDLL